jgi:phosphoribosylanthranilate isomerase
MRAYFLRKSDPDFLQDAQEPKGDRGPRDHIDVTIGICDAGSMKTRIKICCISSRAEAALAIEAGADALGLVAKMPSGPGTISDALINDIISAVPPPISTFLLTNETTAESISAHIRGTHPSVVQAVNHLDPNQWQLLRQLEPSVHFVQVIHVEGPDALNLIPVYSPHIDTFLLDSGRPSAAIPELGGTGRRHDWSISVEFVNASPKPVFLAGGLNAGNVAEAISQVRPFGIDLCSGVRTNGHLDVAKLKAFIQETAKADASL